MFQTTNQYGAYKPTNIPGVAPHCILALKTSSAITCLFHSLLSLLRLLLAALLVRGLGDVEEPLDVGKGWVHAVMAIKTSYKWLFQWDEKHSINGVFYSYL